jgi:hypothetical protein
LIAAAVPELSALGGSFSHIGKLLGRYPGIYLATCIEPFPYVMPRLENALT